MPIPILTHADKERLNKAYALVVEAVKKAESVWLVYQLINCTKKEVYFGVTSRELKDRLIEHARGSTDAISHWVFTGAQKDKINLKVILRNKPQDTASTIAHLCEKSYRQKLKAGGWKVHQTKGI